MGCSMLGGNCLCLSHPGGGLQSPSPSITTLGIAFPPEPCRMDVRSGVLTAMSMHRAWAHSTDHSARTSHRDHAPSRHGQLGMWFKAQRSGRCCKGATSYRYQCPSTPPRVNSRLLACTQELGTRTGLLPAGWPIILKRKAVLLADQSGSHMRTKIELLPTNNPRGWFAYATLLGVLRSSELALD